MNEGIASLATVPNARDAVLGGLSVAGKLGVGGPGIAQLSKFAGPVGVAIGLFDFFRTGNPFALLPFGTQIQKAFSGSGGETPDPLDPENFPTGEGLPDTPAPPGIGLGPRPTVTTENLAAPVFSSADLSQFNSPTETFDFGAPFNQGGLVSLLPRQASFLQTLPISYRQY
tara:strand:+ start:6764 stop:7276 length:513 start_codon:yes stop_codon:yes gene_type:complete